jgi:PAS domain-containing protein/CheY-like chemotaxis protein
MLKTKSNASGDLAAAFEALASAVGQIPDLDRFLSAASVALGEFGYTRTSIQSGSSGVNRLAGPEKTFAAGELVVPLQGREESLGYLKFGPRIDGDPFGPSDLYLMGGMAHFIAALADHAIAVGELRRNQELLRFAIEQLPIGVLCFGPDGTLIASNPAAHRLFGPTEEPGPAWKQLKEAMLVPHHFPQGLYLESPSSICFAEVRGEPGRAGVAMITDLTPHVERLREKLLLESYRCRLGGQRLTFAAIEAGGPVGTALRALPNANALLETQGSCGVCDARTIGFTAAGGPLTAVRLLRKLAPLLPREELRIGMAELTGGEANPDALMQLARERQLPADDVLSTSVLIHDPSRGAAEAVALLLDQRYRFEISERNDRTMSLTIDGAFDGAVVSVDGDGAALARALRRERTDLILLLTTSGLAEDYAGLRAELGAVAVIGKPFDAHEIRALCAKHLPPWLW